MTRYLLDTNTLSETIRKRPAPKVVRWLQSLLTHQLFLCSFTIAEIERGIGLQIETQKADQLRSWLESTVLPTFSGRILPFDTDAARIFGSWMARGQRGGQIPPITDAQIAAIAYVHGLGVATRNTQDFATLPVLTYNPWLG